MILPLEKEHLPQVAELERLCFSCPRSLSQLEEDRSNPLGRLFVAEENHQVLGYSGMMVVAGECYVENIAVFPQFRGQGVGRGLTERLIEQARLEHATLITLEVRASNTVAIALYQSLGFEQVGRRKGFYQHPTEDGLLFTKYLQGGTVCES